MDLCDIQQIKALLSRHGFHFSKSMGQNFLVEDWVPWDIAEASGASLPAVCWRWARHQPPSPRSSPGGPGEWSLWNWTGPSSPSCQRPWPAEENVEIVPGDILKTDLAALTAESSPALRRWPVPIFLIILPPRHHRPDPGGVFAAITVMIQREVALRICARPGTPDYGAFSVFCQYHTAPGCSSRSPPPALSPHPR